MEARETREKFNLKRSVDVSIYFHSPGFEIWLLYWQFPFPVSTERLAVNSSSEIAGADIHISKSLLSREDDEECQNYSVYDWSICVKNYLKYQFRLKLNCTIPYFAYLKLTDMTECPDLNTFWAVFSEAMSIIDTVRTEENICLKPCQDPTYNTYTTYIPKRSGLYKDENQYFEVLTYYDNLNVAKQIEFHLYSGERLWGAIGGVMGIFLGYSILSIFLWLIDTVEMKMN